MPDTIPATTSTGATLSVGGATVNSLIDTAGDHDWFAVSLTAGQTYTFSTLAPSSGVSVDTTLTLRNSSGTQLQFNDDAGGTVFSSITFTAASSGTYFVDVGAYSDSLTGGYGVRVTQFASTPDTVPGDSSTTATVTVGGVAIQGSINNASDHDWFKVTLTAGQTYVFSTGAPLSGSGVDTLLTLRDAAGNAIYANDDAAYPDNTYSTIIYTATTSGTYYLDVSAFEGTLGDFALTAAVNTLPLFSNSQIANQLTNGYWGGTSHHFAVAPGGSLSFNVTALTAEGQALARAALQVWSDVMGVTFNETAGSAQITFDDSDTGAYATANYSGGITSSAAVNVGTDWLTNYGTGINSYSFQTYIHEIGHALGLGHAGNYNGAAAYPSDARYINDSWATTVMSYFSQEDNTWFGSQGFNYTFVLTPLYADIVAIQNLYGITTGTRTGNTTYGFGNNTGNAIYDADTYQGAAIAIFDNGGVDTLNFGSFATGYNQMINLNAERFSNIGGSIGNLTISRGVVIENAVTGLGNDVVYGNNVGNVITMGAGVDIAYGNGGNDTLNGNGGNDTLVGGNGLDTLNGGDDNDTLNGGQGADIANGGNGNDTIVNSETARGGLGDDSITGGAGFRNFLYGDDGNDVLIGAELGDVFQGGAGNDLLIGGLGRDDMTGGLGADAFRFDDGEFGGNTNATADIITDFNRGQGDKIRLNLVDAVNGGADNAFSFIGTVAFSNVAGQLRYQVINGNTFVSGDTNGDAAADFMLRLNGNIALIATDFAL